MRKEIMSYLIEKKQIWYRCLRCGYEWLPRKKKGKPRVCPHCRSEYWDKPRKYKLKYKIKTPNSV